MAITLTNDTLKFRESTSDPWERLLIQANINFNLIYPVGSIYMSTVNVDPGTIFGGTWERLKDKFLLGAGDTYTAGDTGGESTHTLTGNELPKTNGSFRIRRMSWGTAEASNASMVSGQSGIVTSVQPVGSGVDSVAYYNGVTRGMDEVTLSFGSDSAHNNMPPYIVVYMWRRLTLSPTVYTPPTNVLIGKQCGRCYCKPWV